MSKLKITVSVLALALLTAGAHAMGRGNPNADVSRNRSSASGAFSVSYEPAVSPVPKRELHAWTMQVRSRDGRPVDGAQLAISGGMPDHGHGLPTQPKVQKALGDGRYVVDGMKFNMGGYWVVDVDIVAGSVRDRVRFELNL
jgi:hypothetical protein